MKFELGDYVKPAFYPEKSQIRNKVEEEIFIKGKEGYIFIIEEFVLEKSVILKHYNVPIAIHAIKHASPTEIAQWRIKDEQ